MYSLWKYFKVSRSFEEETTDPQPCMFLPRRLCVWQKPTKKRCCKDDLYAYMWLYTHIYESVSLQGQKATIKQLTRKTACDLSLLCHGLTSQDLGFFFYCEYCTRDGIAHISSQMYLDSSHSTPGRDWPAAVWIWHSSCTESSNSEKTIIYYGCFYSSYEIHTPTKHLHIFNLIHN